MKVVMIIVGVLLVGAIAVGISGSSSTQSSTSPSLTMDVVRADMQGGGVLIDVRTAEEFSSGYIQDAVNLPLASIELGVVPKTSKESKIYVYCRSGNRSAQAKSILEKAGFVNVVDLGGIEEVVAIGGVKIK